MTLCTCRFCKGWTSDEDKMVKYGVRHYAHHDCYLKAGKPLKALSRWQVQHFPYFVLKAHGLLEEAERLSAKKVTLPVDEVPEGFGWSILTGNTELNVWVRN